MVFLQDVIHGVGDAAGHRAVDGRGGGLVGLGAGIGDDAAGGQCTVLQGPQEALVPLLARGVGVFDVRKRTGDAFQGVGNVLVNRLAIAILQAVFLVPDIQRCVLKPDIHHRMQRLDHFTHDPFPE